VNRRIQGLLSAAQPGVLSSGNLSSGPQIELVWGSALRTGARINQMLNQFVYPAMDRDATRLGEREALEDMHATDLNRVMGLKERFNKNTGQIDLELGPRDPLDVPTIGWSVQAQARRAKYLNAANVHLVNHISGHYAQAAARNKADLRGWHQDVATINAALEQVTESVPELRLSVQTQTLPLARSYGTGIMKEVVTNQENSAKALVFDDTGVSILEKRIMDAMRTQITPKSVGDPGEKQLPSDFFRVNPAIMNEAREAVMQKFRAIVQSMKEKTSIVVRRGRQGGGTDLLRVSPDPTAPGFLGVLNPEEATKEIKKLYDRVVTAQLIGMSRMLERAFAANVVSAEDVSEWRHKILNGEIQVLNLFKEAGRVTVDAPVDTDPSYEAAAEGDYPIIVTDDTVSLHQLRSYEDRAKLVKEVEADSALRNGAISEMLALKEDEQKWKVMQDGVQLDNDLATKEGLSAQREVVDRWLAAHRGNPFAQQLATRHLDRIKQGLALDEISDPQLLQTLRQGIAAHTVTPHTLAQSFLAQTPRLTGKDYATLIGEYYGVTKTNDFHNDPNYKQLKGYLTKSKSMNINVNSADRDMSGQLDHVRRSLLLLADDIIRPYWKAGLSLEPVILGLQRVLPGIVAMAETILNPLSPELAALKAERDEINKIIAENGEGAVRQEVITRMQALEPLVREKEQQWLAARNAIIYGSHDNLVRFEIGHDGKPVYDERPSARDKDRMVKFLKLQPVTADTIRAALAEFYKVDSIEKATKAAELAAKNKRPEDE